MFCPPLVLSLWCLCLKAEEDDWIEEANILVLVLLEDFVSMIQNDKQVGSLLVAVQLLASDKIYGGF